MEEKQTIDGWGIEKRDLTEEEAAREITFDRFQEFLYLAGEDFIDYHSYGNAYIFCGWLMAKYPEQRTILLDLVNKESRYFTIQSIQHSDLYTDENEDEDYVKFYTDYAEFANLTVHTKKSINQILIQIAEHYGPKTGRPRS